MLAGILTSGELAYLRSKQACILWLDVDAPPVVFACQVNQSFATLDGVAEIAYDSITTGAYTDVLAGMTLWVGSAAGLHDVGMCRIRKAADATKIYVGEHSDIPWEGDLYLTVVDEFGLWIREKRPLSDGLLRMDYEIAYSDQHSSFSPIVNAGPARRVVKLIGETVDLQYDLSGSWVFGSTLSTYAVNAPGSSAVTGGDTATPTIQYNATGRYRIAFTVTAANGKSTTAYRTVRIWSDEEPLEADFALESCHGEYENGGWEFSVKMYGEQANIHDRAMVTLVAQDYYDGVETSIGPVEGYENILAIGWVDGETIEYDPHGGAVKFTVKGPHWWMKQLAGSDVSLKNSAGTPDGWEEMQALTIDQALYHLVYWRSTVAAVMDVYKSGDTRIAPELVETAPGLWSKLQTFSNKIFGRACCDRHGRLFVEIDPQLTEAGSRSGRTVMALEKGDWLEDGLEITRRLVTPGASVNLSTWLVSQGAQVNTLYSLSPGHVFERWGSETIMDNYLAGSQEQSNAMAGLFLGHQNREFDFGFSLAMNNRAVDICPAQYVSVDIVAGDTVRGVAYADKVVVREVEFVADKRGFLLTKWYGEQESIEENSVNGDIPDGEGGFIELPSMPSLPSLPTIPGTLPVTGDDVQPQVVAAYVVGKGFWYTETFDEDSPIWYSWNAGLSSAKISNDNYWGFEVSQASGRGWCFDNDENLLSSPYPGAPWEVVVDQAWLIGQVGYGAASHAPTIGLIGINRGASDQVFMVAGNMYSIYPGKTASFVGSSSGLTKSWEISSGGHAYGVSEGQLGFAVYGYAAWLGLWKGSTEHILVSFDAAGDLGTKYDVGNISADMGYLVRGGLGGQCGALWNVGTPEFRKIDGNGATLTGISGLTPYKVTYQPYLSIAVDPSGLYMVGLSNSTGAPNLRISSDGGVTWSAPGSWSGVGRAAENCGDTKRWIVQASNGIIYSGDQFTTWADKTGDLRVKTSKPTDFMAFIIRYIR